MRCTRNGPFLLMIIFGLTLGAWGQGGSQSGRGAAAQQAGAGGRGGRAGSGGSGDLYNYDAGAGSGISIPDAPPVESRQKITVNGAPLAYTTRTGYQVLRNATTGQPEAHVFFTAYFKDGVSDVSARPLLFFFGGAPGVAASWQEFGGLGPKRLNPAAGAAAGWAENPDTPLGQADLVFVNPVGTAYSRPDQPGRAPYFWTTGGDNASLGEFVRGFTGTYGRRNSPLLLGGEDFGLGRVAGVAAYLLDHQTPVRGLALLSVAPSADALAGDAQYITLLPSLCLAAWYHKKLAPELEALSADQVAEQARQFASREYLHALYKGDRMTAEERARAVAELSRLTGLSKAFVTSNDLRISLDRFNAELLRDQRRALSSSDARVTGFVPAVAGVGRGGAGAVAAGPIDYNMNHLSGAFLTAYEAYLQHDLNFTAANAGIYYLSGGGIGSFTSTGNDDAALAGLFARAPDLRLFVGLNYFDLNAPFYASEFTLAHISLAPDVRAHNLTVSHFEAGQMSCIDATALPRLCQDLAKFIGASTSR